MVIIAREFAVTVLRVAVGAQQGVVIPASQFGKLKTALQVLMVMALIAFHSRPLGSTLLVYVTVAITVLSGVDYFFGLRRRLADSGASHRRARAASRAEPRRRARASGGRAEPACRLVCAGRRAARQLGADLPQRAEALGDDVVLVDRLQVDLAGRDEARSSSAGNRVDHAADHLAHAVLDEPRPAMGLLDHVGLVGALHQLVDLR